MKKVFGIIFVSFLAVFSFHADVLAGDADITIKEIKGLVQVQKPAGSQWAAAAEGSTVTSGDKVRCFLESSALLVFPDGGEFRLRENTSVDVKDISRDAANKMSKRELKLNLGSLHYKVPPKKEKASEFKIHSSTSIVGITGTEGVMTAKGEGKPSENILIEGATYNTDDQGADGRYQRSGNVYSNDGQSARLFGADVEEESALRMAISQESVDLIKGAVEAFKAKRDEGYRVGGAEPLIKQAFFYLEKREYDLVRQTVEQAAQLLENAKKSKIPFELDGKMTDIAAAINDKEAEGHDVAKLYVLLAKAQGLKQSGEFSGIKPMLTQIEKELALLTEETRSGDNDGSFLSLYQNIQKKVLEKGQRGFATGENRVLLREARMFYDLGEKSRAYLFLKEAEDKLSLAMKNVSDAFMAKIARLEDEIASKKAASYPTKEIELRLERVKALIKEENFLKARESVAAIEESLAVLAKSISAEWQIKISDLKRNVNHKRTIGYNLDEIPGLIGEIGDYQAQGDLANLELTYNQAIEDLAALKLPDGFEADWKVFLKQKEAKAEQGYNIKTINDLIAQIETALATADIKSARTFLAQAKKTLTELKDKNPPKVQVISFTENENEIRVEGFASDNTKIKNVSVNGSLVELTKEGKFSFDTAPNPLLEELTILAEDIEGNISAPVVLTVTAQGKAIDNQAVVKNITGEYLREILIVNGEFVPGGKVKVGTVETVCNDDGQFKVAIKPDRNKTMGSIAVAGILSDDTGTQETALAVEDKWAPKIKITKVSFNNNFVPALNVDPLLYDEHKLSVSGQVVLTQMANIEGIVYDLGGEIESLRIENTDVDIRKDGVFNASLSIDRSRKDPTVKIVAKDKSGNATEIQTALDATWNWPTLRINNARVFQKSRGKFSKEISLTADTTDVTIVVENSNGETLVSRRLPVAAVLPPELEIQDVRYAQGKIMISGRSTADATVSDKNKTLFKEDVEVTKNAIFTLTADYPPVDQGVILVASNIEGKLSNEVKIVAGPPKDDKAPVLYLSAPQKDKKGMIIKGFVEDDSQVARLTVHGTAVGVSDQGFFSRNIETVDGLNSVEVTAADIFNNEVKKIIAFSDKVKPEITIDTWEARGGRLVIAGKATDNIGIRQVRLNDMPIAVGGDRELAFSYDGVLTENSHNAVIIAVDLLNNEATEGPREITLPVDTAAPNGKSITMEYGSPVVYASGAVIDPAGIKAVYVNGEKVELFKDGTFDIKVSIDVGLPKIELESPAYDQGKLAVSGKVAAGDFHPAKITVEAEDLSGNRGVLFSQAVVPYQLNELEVSVNGQVVEIAEQGNFRYEQPVVPGQRAVEIKARDPFDNSVFESLGLEDKKPVLSLDPLEYNAGDETVVLSGKAQDEGSGLYTVTVNGIRTDVSNDGTFTYKTTFHQRSLNVIATDYIGNETSLTKEVKPPDVWAPVFSLNVSPMPAIVGAPVYVEIAALDSKTRLPEILKNTPVVSADADGAPVALTVAGEGANYIATLETAGLNAALVTVRVQGEDEAGNKSTETEGTNAFALVADDTIAPSFTVETVPSPLALGVPSTVKVLSSEDLKEIPSLTATLPSGVTNALVLSGSGPGTYQASLTVPVEEGMGTVLLKLSGGVDLSGNAHDTTETPAAVTAPVTVAELPLNINSIDFVAERFILNGQTSSGAIVRMEAGRFAQDIVADAQGLFKFERPVSLAELEDMYTRGSTVAVKLKAHNYAGFESRQRFFEVPLPPLPERGGTNFEIRLFPSPAGQGELINISVDARVPLPAALKGFLYLPDGQSVLIDLQGRDVFTAQYAIPENAALGTAMFEVVSGEIRESIPVEIVLSNKWMQRLNKYEFFRIRVSQDPLILGERGEFFVETMGDLPRAPRLEIRLPNGRVDNIPLSGDKRFFQGTYVSPADLTPGSAELVLNPGMPEEIRRPYGIEDQFAEEDFIDVFLYANPNPLIGGKPYDVNLSFSQNVPFKPRLVLRLQNGRTIEMPLDGSAFSNKFTARGTLANDVESGLAKFVLFDDRGMVIDQFPAQVSARFMTSTGKDIFIVPDVLRRREAATIQLNSAASLYGKIEGRVSFPDGTRTVVPLEGTETLRKGTFTVPDYVTLGMMTISVLDDAGIIGTVNAQIVESGAMEAPVYVFLDNPEFQPYERVRLNVETDWPLMVIPKAELFWDGGSFKIALTGQVPGNRFMGEFMAPGDPIARGRIEIRDDRGSLLGDFPLDRGAPEGEGEIIVTPMPPVIGQPLSIKVVAPSVVDSAPMFRLIFEDGGQQELNAYGPLPGDTFTASLAVLQYPLQLIEIIHEGKLIESIPVEYLSMSTFDFSVDVIDDYLMPCDITDVIVRSNSYVPFMPYMSVDFNGRVMDVPLSKISPTDFLGRMNVPCDVSFDSYNMRVFDPQGKLLWQRSFVSDTADAGLLTLLVMPVDATSVELSWNMVSGIDGYEIRYGETAALGRTAFAGNVSRFTLPNLTTGKVYFFKVAARKSYQDIMVSDIIDAVVGGTTRELPVNFNVMDNDVNLYWTDYGGADMYRVQWGTAIGNYPHSFDTSALNYYIPDLAPGGYYYIKVKALQKGVVIGESRDLFIHIEEFMATGGEIYFAPEPAMVGQSLMIDMHFFQDLPFVPRVVVRLQDKEVTLTPTGQYRDYEAYLTASAFTTPIMVVDVLDPEGRIIASRSPAAGVYSGTMVPIEVIPESPMIGASLQVKVNFPEPVLFVPRLVIEFASGIKPYASTQAAYLSSYEWYIPVADMSSSVLYMKVVDPDNGTLVAERVFSGGSSDGYADVPFTVMPNPPIVGQSVNMQLNTDVAVSLAPKLRIYFASGMQEVNMYGTLPGQYFTHNIGTLNSVISKIDIVNPMTGLVVHTWNPAAAVPTSCEIVVPYDPPLVAQSLPLRAQFPAAVSFTPRIRVYLTNGATKYYTFPQGPGLSTYEIFIPAADIVTNVERIEIWNDTNSLILGERLFSTTAVFVQALTVSPTSPVVGQSLEVHVEFNIYVGFTPRWRLHTTTQLYEGNFSQGSGFRVYDQTIPSSNLSSPVMELEIYDNLGNFISNGELFFNVAQDFTCTAEFSPEQPRPYTSLVVMANYPAGEMPSYIPWVFVEFDGGGHWPQVFPGAAGMPDYAITIPGSNITDDVWKIGIGQYPGDVIDCGREFSAAGPAVGTLSINDPELVPGDTFYATATFENPTSFVPGLWIEFSDLTSQNYFFNGPSGSSTYYTGSITIDRTVHRIVLKDQNGNEIDDLIFDNQDFQVTSIDAVGSNQINLCWTYIEWIDEYRIYYGTASGTYNGDESPVIISGSSCYTLGNYETLLSNTPYYVKVEAFDAGAFKYGSQEETVTLTTTSVEYPTNLRKELTGVSGEIKVFWDSVPNVDGYRVYFGTASRTYNESGSPLEIQDPSVRQEVIKGLFNNILYYITVEAYIGTMESNNPNEISSYAGTGGGTLSSSVSSLSLSGAAGMNTPQQSVTVTNNGTTAVNVKTKASDLIFGTNVIPYTRYTISPTSASLGASGGSQSFTVNLSVPLTAADGLYAGDITFYADTDGDSYRDDGEPFVTMTVSLTIASSYDHLRMTAETTSSPMGTPIFVTITAEDANDNIVRSYDETVTIEVSESSGGLIADSWILSTNGAPGGPSTSTVAMSGGVGNFTVDAQEPEELWIELAGADGSPLNLEFFPSSGGSTEDSYAIIGPNRASTGGAGATVWVAVIDDTGRVVIDSTQTITLSTDGGDANVVPSVYTLTPADNGQFQAMVTSNIADTVTLTASGALTTDGTFDIVFTDTTKYLVNGVYGSRTINTGVGETQIKLIIQAANDLEEPIRFYSGTATLWSDSGLAGNENVIFQDGRTEVVLNQVMAGSGTFRIDENGGNGSTTEDITIDFTQNDESAPEVIRAEMDTPWIVHLYFDEELDSSTAGTEGNYTGIPSATVEKVCWYGDNVTLHLSAAPGASSFTVTINNVRDKATPDPNTMISYTTPTIYVPDIDYTGGPANGAEDWFEVQVSDAHPASGDSVHVIVYHKNVCGYLSGDNRVNFNTDVQGSIDIHYGGTLGETGLVSPPLSVTIEDGKAEFDVTIQCCIPAGTTEISASASGMTKTTIATINIPGS